MFLYLALTVKCSCCRWIWSFLALFGDWVSPSCDSLVPAGQWFSSRMAIRVLCRSFKTHIWISPQILIEPLCCVILALGFFFFFKLWWIQHVAGAQNQQHVLASSLGSQRVKASMTMVSLLLEGLSTLNEKSSSPIGCPHDYPGCKVSVDV